MVIIQGSEMSAGFHYMVWILGIHCFRLTSLENLTNFEIFFWLQSKNYVADALDNDRELDQEFDSNLQLRNVSQNITDYNIKYMD